MLGSASYPFFAFCAFFNGLVISVNLGVNGCLAQRIGSPLYVACASCCVASLLELLALKSSAPAPISSNAEFSAKLRSAPFWVWLGGAVSAYTFTAGIVVSASVGVALTSLMIMVGHIATAVAVDLCGLSGQQYRAFTRSRFHGLVLVVFGAAMTATDQATTDVGAEAAWRLLLNLGVLLLVGVCIPAMGLINGRLTDVLGHPLRAACVSDALTACILFCASSAMASRHGMPHDLLNGPLWHWLGGPCTACFTCIIIIVPKYIGMSAYSCCFIAGEQFFGLLVDELGLFMVQRPATLQRVLGVCVAVVGALLYQSGGAKTRDVVDKPSKVQSS